MAPSRYWGAVVPGRILFGRRIHSNAAEPVSGDVAVMDRYCFSSMMITSLLSQGT